MGSRKKPALMRAVREYGAACANVQWAAYFSTTATLTQYKRERDAALEEIKAFRHSLPPPPKPKKEGR